MSCSKTPAVCVGGGDAIQPVQLAILSGRRELQYLQKRLELEVLGLQRKYLNAITSRLTAD